MLILDGAVHILYYHSNIIFSLYCVPLQFKDCIESQLQGIATQVSVVGLFCPAVLLTCLTLSTAKQQENFTTGPSRLH